jgi:uncharacterized protein YodC (DUF2158 family)
MVLADEIVAVSVVRLKSGGPSMTVKWIGNNRLGEHGALCQWSFKTKHRGNPETLEIASALKRSLHRIGLRQGVLRVLERIGQSALKSEWDRLY